MGDIHNQVQCCCKGFLNDCYENPSNFILAFHVKCYIKGEQKVLLRPMIWVLGAYLAGMYLAWHKITAFILICILVFFFFVLYLFLFRIPNPLINRKDFFLLFLPVCLLLGFLSMDGRMKPPELEEMFDDEVPCDITGTISMVVVKQTGKAIYLTNNSVYVNPDQRYLCENLIVYTSDSQNYQTGNQITVTGKLLKFTTGTNPGQFNEKRYYQIAGIDYKVYAKEITITNSDFSLLHVYLDQIKQQMILSFQTILPEKEAGTIIAMTLGDKYLLDEEIKGLYQENGISHIIAISGLHITLIGYSLYKLLRKCRLSLNLCVIFTITFIYGYGILTNFSVSTNRAIVMLSVMLLAAVFGKTYDMISATSLSAFLILLQNPLQIFQAGFLLSFGAVMGIAIIHPALQLLFPAKNAMIDAMKVSFSAQVMTTPFLLCFYYQFPVYNLLINILILPTTSILILTSLIAGIAAIIYRPLGIFLIGGTDYILKFYEALCRFGRSLPFHLLTVGYPAVYQIVIYIVMVVVFTWCAYRYGKKIAVLPLVFGILVLLWPFPQKGLEITMLDVGQGDGIFMKTETGRTYLFDGGSTDVKKVGKYRLQPFLLWSGVDRIDYCIISHSDNDHVNGVKELLESDRIRIMHLILPYINKKEDAYLELEELAKKQGVKVQYMEVGDQILDGKLNMVCLHPYQDDIPSSINAYSLVISLSYGEFDMLFTGDLEKEGEDSLVKILETIKTGQNEEGIINKFKDMESRRKIAWDYDVLKVAHHGSKNSTHEELLQIIRPEMSLISCGKDNSYGHPGKELLERLELVNSDYRITYQSGAITIKTDGTKMWIGVTRGVTRGRGE